MDFECLYDRRTLYPVSHIFTPFLIYLLTHRFDIVITLIVLWEIFEFITYASADSYIIFEGSAETICDIVLLDLGHGLLGILLSWWIVYVFKFPKIRMTSKRWLITGIFAVCWIFSISLDFECEYWGFKCDYTAWGVPILTFLLPVYATSMYMLGMEDQQVFWAVALVGTLYLNITWIPESTPLLMYYASILIFVLSLLIPWIYTKCGSSPSYARVERSTRILIT